MLNESSILLVRDQAPDLKFNPATNSILNVRMGEGLVGTNIDVTGPGKPVIADMKIAYAGAVVGSRPSIFVKWDWYTSDIDIVACVTNWIDHGIRRVRIRYGKETHWRFLVTDEFTGQLVSKLTYTQVSWDFNDRRFNAYVGVLTQ